MTRDPTTHQALLAALPEATARGRQALEDWDAISDSLCDEHHQPLDERYDLRQHQRDAEAWNAFAPFLDHGPQLLARAEEDFRALHQDLEDPDLATIARRRSQLTTLHHAIDGGRRERDTWQTAHEMILPDHPRSPETLRRGEILRNAEGWHYAITWADNADVLVEIDQEAHTRQITGHARTAQAAHTRSAANNAPTPTPTAEDPAPPQPCGPSRGGRSR